MVALLLEEVELFLVCVAEEFLEEEVVLLFWVAGVVLLELDEVVVVLFWVAGVVLLDEEELLLEVVALPLDWLELLDWVAGAAELLREEELELRETVEGEELLLEEDELLLEEEELLLEEDDDEEELLLEEEPLPVLLCEVLLDCEYESTGIASMLAAAIVANANLTIVFISAEC